MCRCLPSVNSIPPAIAEIAAASASETIPKNSCRPAEAVRACMRGRLFEPEVRQESCKSFTCHRGARSELDQRIRVAAAGPALPPAAATDGSARSTNEFQIGGSYFREEDVMKQVLGSSAVMV